MFKKLKNWFMARSCNHKWVHIKTTAVLVKELSMDIPAGHKYLLQCEHCGDMKIFADLA